MKPRLPAVRLIVLCAVIWLPHNTAAAPATAVVAPVGSYGWITPPPPYPEVARQKREQGTVYVKITTDASGVVTKAVASVPIRQRQDVSDLGVSSVRWVLARWHGPPNVTHKLEMIYRLR